MEPAALPSALGTDEDSYSLESSARADETPADSFTSLDEHIEDCGNHEITCPSQSCVGFWDQNDGLFHLYRTVCKRWTCPYCGRVKRAKLQADIQAARPNRFLTLTTANHADATPRQIFDWTRRQVSELGKAIRREGSSFEYLRCLEATKTGYPHYHLLVRSGWLDQHELSAKWCRLTRAFIVDIRALSKDEKAARYVMKYLTKQGTVPFTTRRLSWTRNFFHKTEQRQATTHSPIEVERHSGTLEHVVYWHYAGACWERVNRWHWIRKAPLCPKTETPSVIYPECGSY